MKKDYILIILFFAIFINCCNFSFADSNSISRINIEASIKDDGDVEFTELWKGNFYSGTELYHFYEGFLVSDISNFGVYESGVKFENLESWNIADSKNAKKQKSSINQTSDGIELVWGIGEPGYHEYKLKYTLNGIFQNNELKLKILDEISPESAEIVIKGNFNENAFASLKNCLGNTEVKSKQVKYNIEKINENLTIYLNYDGIDNSLNKDNIIRIKSNSKNKIFFILKNGIAILLFFIFIIIIVIISVNRKNEKYEFKPF